nr:MAG TPA: hypothetical protein [Caudoviricetes sp.]
MNPIVSTAGKMVFSTGLLQKIQQLAGHRKRCPFFINRKEKK